MLLQEAIAHLEAFLKERMIDWILRNERDVSESDILGNLMRSISIFRLMCGHTRNPPRIYEIPTSIRNPNRDAALLP